MSQERVWMATFVMFHVSTPNSKEDQKMPKTAENRQNRQKTPIPYLKNFFYPSLWSEWPPSKVIFQFHRAQKTIKRHAENRQNHQKTPIRYLKNDLSYELLLSLILNRIPTFSSNISIPSSKDYQKTPKTAENRLQLPKDAKTISQERLIAWTSFTPRFNQNGHVS